MEVGYPKISHRIPEIAQGRSMTSRRQRGGGWVGGATGHRRNIDGTSTEHRRNINGTSTEQRRNNGGAEIECK